MVTYFILCKDFIAQARMWQLLTVSESNREQEDIFITPAHLELSSRNIVLYFINFIKFHLVFGLLSFVFGFAAQIC